MSEGKKESQRVRLYVKGTFTGFRRNRCNHKPDTSLIKIEGVRSKEETEWYMGKRIAFVYRASREIDGSKFRCIWGRVTRHHGNSGMVRAKFKHNLPARAMGSNVRVMLYPSRV